MSLIPFAAEEIASVTDTGRNGWESWLANLSFTPLMFMATKASTAKPIANLVLRNMTSSFPYFDRKVPA